MPDEVDRIENHGRHIYQLLEKYRVDVPPGKAGAWSIQRFKTEMGLEYVRHAFDGREPGLGEFTRLVHKQRGVVMSDTAAEVNDLRWYLNQLEGRVLITGLGLGMVVHCLTRIPKYSESVESITIVEKDADIIALSGPHYRKDARVNIVHADAYEWRPPKGALFDAAWHDVWDTISLDNEFGRMRRHYQRYMTLPRHQFCWGEAYARSHNR